MAASSEAASLTIVVMGASGDLARKKTYPALFSVFCNGLFPPNTQIAGFARSAFTEEKFHARISSCFPKGKEEEAKEFLAKCFYFRGQYTSAADYKRLDDTLIAMETKLAPVNNRIFYMAIPPSIFVPVATNIRGNAMAPGWTRVVVEKPFGKDLESSEALGKALGALFTEEQLYRIDHYLGKEMVQNLMVLRFANSVFTPMWNRHYIKCVKITFKEPFGTKGRGGYFDEFGIIRDVMQNHLLQIMSLVAMEPPASRNAEDVRNEKVKVLKCVKPIVLEDVVLGQYGEDPLGSETSYIDDPTVPNDSVTPTFAAAVLHVQNDRWAGVPFILKCGKALDARKAEIRVQFQEPYNNLYPNMKRSRNELVIRVQPNEAIYLKMNLKEPGLSGDVCHKELDFTYKAGFGGKPDVRGAYETLIYDVIRGDHNLFVRGDELTAAWKIFTPLLHRIEGEKIKPEPYEFGSRRPVSSDALSKKYGYEHDTQYRWEPPSAVHYSRSVKTRRALPKKKVM